MSAAAMACYPELFRAGAVVAGAAYRGAVSKELGRKAFEDQLQVSAAALGKRVTALHPNATHYPKLIIVHGSNDPLMDFNEGEALAKQWAVVHNVDTLPTRVERNFNSVIGVDQRSYSDAVTFYEFNGLGPQTARAAGGTTTAWVQSHIQILLRYPFHLLDRTGIRIGKVIVFNRIVVCIIPEYALGFLLRPEIAAVRSATLGFLSAE